MIGQTSPIDDSVKQRILEYPIRELFVKLFPGHPIGRSGLTKSPFRKDRRPSFSMYSKTGTISMWKDHSTGEYGDNIALYRKLYPNLSYMEAVDSLADFLFKISAYKKECDSVSSVKPVRRDVNVPQVLQADKPGYFTVHSAVSVDAPSVPVYLKEYWRGRGISDDVMKRMGCMYFILESEGMKGRELLDDSGSPIVGEDGNVLVSDGLFHAVGMYNDIGGVIFRIPDSDHRTRVHKGGTNVFISTVLAGDGRPSASVSYVGAGSNRVESVSYDSRFGCLVINPLQSFQGVCMGAAPYAMEFVRRFVGTVLDERSVKCICAVLNSLNAPKMGRSVIVEGMFDGLSLKEIRRWQKGLENGSDLVILNGVGNAKWAVPFLCMHSQVELMLDNDVVSHAGQNTSSILFEQIKSFNKAVGGSTTVLNASGIFGKSKDLNEALMVQKGLKGPSL